MTLSRPARFFSERGTVQYFPISVEYSSICPPAYMALSISLFLFPGDLRNRRSHLDCSSVVLIPYISPPPALTSAHKLWQGRQVDVHLNKMLSAPIASFKGTRPHVERQEEHNTIVSFRHHCTDARGIFPDRFLVRDC